MFLFFFLAEGLKGSRGTFDLKSDVLMFTVMPRHDRRRPLFKVVDEMVLSEWGKLKPVNISGIVRTLSFCFQKAVKAQTHK